MERIVASYRVGDHTVDVIEIIDDDGEWTELAIDGELLDVHIRPGHVPSEDEAASYVDEWVTSSPHAVVDGPPDDATTVAEPLSEREIADLHAALDDEYQAHATYTQVIADFGAVRPFTNIVDAERRHIEAVTSLLDRYGVPVPADTWPGRVPRYPSVHDACEAAVAAEIANGALYDRLLTGTRRPDLLRVYRNLQRASQQRHLPAFRRCSQRHTTHQDHRRRRRRGFGAP